MFEGGWLEVEVRDNGLRFVESGVVLRIQIEVVTLHWLSARFFFFRGGSGDAYVIQMSRGGYQIALSNDRPTALSSTGYFLTIILAFLLFSGKDKVYSRAG